MEALSLRWARLCLVALVLSPSIAKAGAGHRTPNFWVDAPTGQLAKEIGDAAERYRRDLALEWLGEELPQWSKPCPIKAVVAPNLGAGGATSFVFDRGEVFGWRMEIQGSRERILDSVLPHEVTHTIFACHFRQPLPRWADEGACTTVEHDSEILKQENMLIEFLQTRRGIPFSQMFRMKDYPQDVLPLYAQGHALAEYLIEQRGKRAFLSFLADGMTDENWERAIEQHYGYQNMKILQDSWLDWVKVGRPDGQLMANNLRGSRATQVSNSTVVRGQDPGTSSGQWQPVASAPTTSEVQQVAAASSGPSIYEALSAGQAQR